MSQNDDVIPAADLADPTDRNRSLRKKLPIVILILSVGTVVDLVLDKPPTIWSAHVLFELLLMLFGLGAAAYFWLRWRDTDTELVASRVALAEQTAERDAWRGKYPCGPSPDMGISHIFSPEMPQDSKRYRSQYTVAMASSHSSKRQSRDKRR